MDLDEPFDTMCDKCIYYFGIRGVSLKWFKYYLDNRTQMVKIQYKDEQVRSDPLRKGRTTMGYYETFHIHFRCGAVPAS